MPALVPRRFAPRLRGLRAAPLLLVLGRFRPKNQAVLYRGFSDTKPKVIHRLRPARNAPASGDRNRLFGGSESLHRGIGIASAGQM